MGSGSQGGEEAVSADEVLEARLCAMASALVAVVAEVAQVDAAFGGKDRGPGRSEHVVDGSRAGGSERTGTVEDAERVQRDESTADVAAVTEREVADVLGGKDSVLPNEVDDSTVAIGQVSGELRERVL